MVPIIFFLFLTSTSYSLAQNVYPCAYDDESCIAFILDANSNCNKAVFGSVPREFFQQNVIFQDAYTNVTFVDQYAITKNIDKCYVSEFFFNLTSNVLVLSVDCPKLYVEVLRTTVQHTPNGLNRYYSAKIYSDLPPIVFTVNLKHADDIDLCDAFVFTYLDGQPEYQIIPLDDNSKKYYRRKSSGALRSPQIYIREEMLHYGGPVFRQYVNNILCDFGCAE